MFTVEISDELQEKHDYFNLFESDVFEVRDGKFFIYDPILDNWYWVNPMDENPKVRPVYKKSDV